jgi:hypothetical protein
MWPLWLAIFNKKHWNDFQETSSSHLSLGGGDHIMRIILGASRKVQLVKTSYLYLESKLFNFCSRGAFVKHLSLT